ncbi:MAG: OmpA family protein [Flavobacteriales bacterium]
MKKHYYTMCMLLLPFIAYTQNQLTFIDKEKFSVGLNVGSVYDHYADNGIESFTNFSSNYEDDLSLGFSASLYYDLTPNFSLGIDAGFADIYGDNNEAYYYGEFKDFNFTTKLNFLRYRNIELYGRLSSGIVQYDAVVKVKDDKSVFNRESGESLKSSVALGLEYQIKPRLSVLFDANFNRVASDNFDGINERLENSKYFVTSIGVQYQPGLSKKEQESSDLENFTQEVDQKMDSNNKYLKNEIDRLSKKLKKIEQQEPQNNRESVTDYKEQNREPNFDLNQTIFYKPGKYFASLSALENLAEISQFMKKNSDYKAIITGYTDSDASNALNNELAQKRAENIQSYLSALGINKSRIQTVYKGEENPIVPNKNDIYKQLNRRVEISLIK